MPASPDVLACAWMCAGCRCSAWAVRPVRRGAPDGVAVTVSVELCSLTFPTVKPTVSGLVGTAMFGDGAAAVVAVGDRRAAQDRQGGASGPDIVDSRSRLYPESLNMMAWNVSSAGLQPIFSPEL